MADEAGQCAVTIVVGRVTGAVVQCRLQHAHDGEHKTALRLFDMDGNQVGWPTVTWGAAPSPTGADPSD